MQPFGSEFGAASGCLRVEIFERGVTEGAIFYPRILVQLLCCADLESPYACPPEAADQHTSPRENPIPTPRGW